MHWLGRILLVCSLVSLTACVTYEDPMFTKKYSSDQELARRLELSRGYLAEGNIELAQRNLVRVLELDDESPGAHEGMALIFQHQGEVKLAEKHYRSALRYGENDSRIRNNYAVFLSNQKRYKEALKQFEKVTEDPLYPRRAAAFYSLAMLQLQVDKVDEAILSFQRSVRLNSHYAASYLELADIYFNRGDFPGAKQYLARYEERAKATPRSLWLAIRVEYKFGNLDAEASKALALKNLFPYSQEYLAYKAWYEAKRAPKRQSLRDVPAEAAAPQSSTIEAENDSVVTEQADTSDDE